MVEQSLTFPVRDWPLPQMPPFNLPYTFPDGPTYTPPYVPEPLAPIQFPMLLPAFWNIGNCMSENYTLDEDRNDEFPECYP